MFEKRLSGGPCDEASPQHARLGAAGLRPHPEGGTRARVGTAARPPAVRHAAVLAARAAGSPPTRPPACGLSPQPFTLAVRMSQGVGFAETRDIFSVDD